MYRILLLLAATLIVAACSPDSAATPTSETTSQQTAEYRTITIDQLAAILESESDRYTVVNVHIPYAGEIAGTDQNIAFNDIDALVSALPDKNAPIVLYCRSGNMSEQAARELVSLGYTQVYDVPGGMYAWTSSGRALINE